MTPDQVIEPARALAAMESTLAAIPGASTAATNTAWRNTVWRNGGVKALPDMA